MSGQPEQSQKTEPATPKSLRKARQKGQVASSKIVPAALSVSVMLFWILYSLERSKILIDNVFSNYSTPMLNNFWFIMGDIVDSLKDAFIVILAPLFFIMILCAVVGNIMVKGLLLSFDPLKPDIKRLNPISGAKKLFKIDHLYLFSSSIVVSIIVIVVGVMIGFHVLPLLLKSVTCGLNCLEAGLRYTLVSYVVAVIVVSLVVAPIDWILQKKLYLRNKKMTKEQVKKEHKQDQGDGQIKSKRREIGRELIEGGKPSGAANLPQYTGNLIPTVYITDDMQKTVGIRYIEGEQRLPIITNIGYLTASAALLESAKKERITIYYSKESAAALFDAYSVGQEVTQQDFQLVVPAIIAAMNDDS